MTEQNKTVSIYLILDEAECPRYVGKSNNPSSRCGLHLKVNKEKSWANYRILEVVAIDVRWEDRERYWIAYYRQRCNTLENITRGGGGASWINGRKLSIEHVAKLPQNQKGFKKSKEARKNLQAAADRRKGIPRPPEVIAKMIGLKRQPITCERISKSKTGKKLSTLQIASNPQVQKGVKKSPEFCKKLSIARTGLKRSPESIAKQSKTMSRVMKGRKLTPEQLAARPQNRKGYKKSLKSEVQV